MSSLPALEVSVSSRRMSCILDGELALSRQGLLFAMRLAQEANVWLFRALWNALDNSHLYPAAAEPDAAGQQRRREASEQWDFFCHDTATTEIYTLSLHDALPRCGQGPGRRQAREA